MFDSILKWRLSLSVVGRNVENRKQQHQSLIIGLHACRTKLGGVGQSFNNGDRTTSELTRMVCDRLLSCTLNRPLFLRSTISFAHQFSANYYGERKRQRAI